MLRQGVRRFTTTACRAAETLAQMEGPNQYGIQVSKAQGVVNGLVGGTQHRGLIECIPLQYWRLVDGASA